MANKEDENLEVYKKKKSTHGKFTLYSKDLSETKQMIKSLAEVLGLKDYQVVDMLLRREVKKRVLI